MKTGGGETRHQSAWKGTHHAQRRVQRGHVLKSYNLYKDDADNCPKIVRTFENIYYRCGRPPHRSCLRPSSQHEYRARWPVTALSVKNQLLYSYWSSTPVIFIQCFGFAVVSIHILNQHFILNADPDPVSRLRSHADLWGSGFWSGLPSIHTVSLILKVFFLLFEISNLSATKYPLGGVKKVQKYR